MNQIFGVRTVVGEHPGGLVRLAHDGLDAVRSS